MDAQIAEFRPEGFEVIEKIGAGGMGVVYKARSLDLGRTVAIKTLPPWSVAEDADSRRFVREAQAIARLNHRNIVQIHELRTNGAVPYYVMEYVPGTDLRQAANLLDFRGRAQLMERVARAVHFAHMNGVIHRDLKPSNILVGADHEPKLLDFGLAMRLDPGETRLTQGSAIVGTPHYVSPEQARGARDLGPASDVYSLGTVFFEILAGRVPFEGNDFLEILEKIRGENPPFPCDVDPAIPEPLQRICLKALEKSASQRYASALAFAEDLCRFLEGRSVVARPTLYDNLLAGRVQGHLEDVDRWRGENLISSRERDHLVCVYEPFLAVGPEWIGESRRIRLPEVLLHLGGWLHLVAAIVWMSFFWGTLGRVERLACTAGPMAILVATGSWFWARRKERVAVAFLLTGSALLPLAAVVWLSEFGAFANVQAGLELLRAGPFTNAQLLAGAAVALVGFLAGARATRVGGFTYLAALALAALHGAVLLRLGLLRWVEDERFAQAAILHLPLCVAATALGWWLDRAWGSRHAQPFYALGTASLVAALTCVAIYGPHDWMGRANDAEEIAQRTWLIGNGVIYYLAAWWFERRGTPLLRWFSRPLYLATPISVLLPLHLMEQQGISFPVGAQVVYLSEVLLPIACIGFVLLAIPLQLKTFFYSGLLYLAIAVQRLTALHFEQTRAWPIALLVLGGSVMILGIVAERVRTRHFPDRGAAPGRA